MTPAPSILVSVLTAGRTACIVWLLVVIPVLIARALRSRTAQITAAGFWIDLIGQAATRARDLERGRLARDLHDDTLQRLARAIHHLDTSGLTSEAQDLRSIATGIREIIDGLHPPSLADLGLDGAIERLAHSLTPEDGTRILVSPPTAPPAVRPPAGVELQLYRIAQEAIGNALTHSRAAVIAIETRISPDEVRLTVADDGVGLGSTLRGATPAHPRHGIRSIEQRAASIGASLTFDDARPGTRVRASWRP